MATTMQTGQEKELDTKRTSSASHQFEHALFKAIAQLEEGAPMSDTIAPICVVDDDVSVREGVGSLIRSAGLRAETFASANEFLASPRAEAPSCLVLDVQLPGLSGLDLQRELLKADVQIPIIFLSGHGDIPMTVRTMKAGALEFLTKPFDDEDLLNAIRRSISAQECSEQSLRKDIALLEHRHHEIEEDLMLAARVQQSLTPDSLAFGGVAVETFFRPVQAIGGDFGLVVPCGDGLSVILCDVSGHGISSALLANRIYTEAMSQVERGTELGQMLRRLNEFVIRSMGGSRFYCTIVAARLNFGALSIELAGASHPPAMVVRPGREPQLIESQSGILGLFEDAVHAEAVATIPILAGDRVVIYTDGLTESFDSRGDMLGVDWLSEIVREASGLPLSAMKKEIIDRIAAWRHGPPTDDMSLIVVEIPPATANPQRCGAAFLVARPS